MEKPMHRTGLMSLRLLCYAFNSTRQFLGCIECMRCRLFLPMIAVSVRQSVLSRDSTRLHCAGVIWCRLCQIVLASCLPCSREKQKRLSSLEIKFGCMQVWLCAVESRDHTVVSSATSGSNSEFTSRNTTSTGTATSTSANVGTVVSASKTPLQCVYTKGYTRPPDHFRVRHAAKPSRLVRTSGDIDIGVLVDCCWARYVVQSGLFISNL